jgi:hypothetical protein
MTEALDDARGVYRQAEEWMGTLATSGVEPRVIVVAVLQAATDKLIVGNGVDPAARYLRSMADQVEKFGPAFLAAIHSEGR